MSHRNARAILFSMLVLLVLQVQGAEDANKSEGDAGGEGSGPGRKAGPKLKAPPEPFGLRKALSLKEALRRVNLQDEAELAAMSAAGIGSGEDLFGLTLHKVENIAGLSRDSKSKLVYFITLPMEDKIRIALPALRSDGLFVSAFAGSMRCVTSLVETIFGSLGEPLCFFASNFLSKESTLMLGVRKNHTALVRSVLNQGANANWQLRRRSQPPLTVASALGYTQIVRMLLDKGAHPDIRDFQNNTALLLSTSHPAVTTLLLRAGADVNLRGNGRTALFAATLNGHGHVMHLLLEAEADADLCEEVTGLTPLMEACRLGDKDAVAQLLRHNANLELLLPETGWSALMVSVVFDQGEIVRLLLDHDANVNVRDYQGQTSLMIAAFRKKGNIVRLLLEAGANVNLQHSHGLTALIVSAGNGDAEEVSLILQAGAELDTRCQRTGYTALMLACQNCHPTVVALLLKAGANTALQDRDGDTPHTLASLSGCSEVVNLLEAAAKKSQ